ncbi:GNAT family N-acetyltransferase [Sphingomonas morindae]|uniref:GNAT family N-acetyltransferase n=1 Tax=Sphingomonas morindae TaxID=1541170 RepID=A0ABY4XAA2_9SPHN|nr:GNAT family N-acetyltransferase [Sphingomonas morindae]USI73625.1 GNAT family N-acetyltransferase [Sphingomonas morindae]
MEFETERLTIRRIGIEDAGFVLAMLNDPGFRANIGDRGVRTIAEAADYVRTRILASYAEHGFGGLKLVRRSDGAAIGTAGFYRRPGLEAPDLGFALFARETRQGYGFEAASGLLASRPDLRPLLAIAAPHNRASAALLAKLGFVEQGLMRLPAGGGLSRLFRLA